MNGAASESRLAVVTGGSGFVGQALCIELQRRGLRVRALSRTRSTGPWDEWMPCDLARDDGVEPTMFTGAACVFHLAARAHARAERPAQRELYHVVNTLGTSRVTQAAMNAGAAGLVFVSSIKAMGEGTDVLQTEDNPARPMSLYGRSKLEGERIVLAASSAQFPTSVLRLPLVYGPGVKSNLARMIRWIERGYWPQVQFPENRRSMVDVRDAAAALFLLANNTAAAGKVFLCTDGEEYSTARVEAAIRGALDRPQPSWRLPWFALRIMASSGDVLTKLLRRRAPFDSTALCALAGSARYDGGRLFDLGFAPKWTLERAMPDMVAAQRRTSL